MKELIDRLELAAATKTDIRITGSDARLLLDAVKNSTLAAAQPQACVACNEQHKGGPLGRHCLSY